MTAPEDINNKKENEKQIMSSKKYKIETLKKFKKTLAALIFWIIIFIFFRFLFPERFPDAISMSSRYLKEVIFIFPAILVMMGLADFWVPSNLVEKYLGYQSSFKGKLLAVFFGTLPTGPMYIAFPIAAELLRKKASLSNVIIFLGVWASLKVPQLGIEIQFIGLKFSVLRFIFTLTSIFIIGILMEKIIVTKE